MANPMAPIQRGAIVPVPNMRVPLQGSQALPITLDFTNSAAVDGQIQSEFDSGEFDYMQSVYIDNSNNPGSLTLIFPGLGKNGHITVAPPFSQGYYACSPPMQDPRFTAVAPLGQMVPIVFYNIPMVSVVWSTISNGASGGIATSGFAPLAIGLGNTQLVAGVPGTTVKLWRGMFEVDAPAILKWTDGPGGTVVWSVTLAALGSISFVQAVGPWFSTLTAGRDLTLNSSAAVNLYGGMGIEQS